MEEEPVEEEPVFPVALAYSDETSVKWEKNDKNESRTHPEGFEGVVSGRVDGKNHTLPTVTREYNTSIFSLVGRQ